MRYEWDPDKAEANLKAHGVRFADVVSVPVIASGGVGTLDHLVAGIVDGGASAVLAASIFHFGDSTIADAHRALAKAGISVRIPI